jgi:hypothetical protein
MVQREMGTLGMDGRTPDVVFDANLEARREMPEAMRKYVTRVADGTAQRCPC